MKRTLIFPLILLGAYGLRAQAQSNPPARDLGQLSGNFQSNSQFYVKDTAIGANTTQYLSEKASTEAWLYLNYNFKGYNFILRYDAFLNSPLLNPQEAYTDNGIGFWQISKDIDKLNITGGYFYDQFGSGMVFRAYEDRLIGLDYAIRGVRAIYQVSPTFKIKAFAGNQKFRFAVRPSVVMGANAEKSFQITKNVLLDVGASFLKRNIQRSTMDIIAADINTYPVNERFLPTYNVYPMNVYANLRWKDFGFYGEYCYKTPEAVALPTGRLIKKAGQIWYGTVTYSNALKGIGINAQYKHIDHFPFRTSPLELVLNGVINYLPSLTRQNTYRLLARYNAVVQELGENAFQIDGVYSPNNKLTFSFNISHVRNLQNKELFTELYGDMVYKVSKKFKFSLGLQRINYDQAILEAKPGVPVVRAITPFGEVVYKFTKTTSLRVEWQYLDTKQDLGSFVNGLAELNVAPHWSFSAGDMINIKPTKSPKPLHYYNFFTSYTVKTTRFTMAYVKQVAGVNCTGGVCRYEPAFSGARFGITTSF